MQPVIWFLNANMNFDALYSRVAQTAGEHHHTPGIYVNRKLQNTMSEALIRRKCIDVKHGYVVLSSIASYISSIKTISENLSLDSRVFDPNAASAVRSIDFSIKMSFFWFDEAPDDDLIGSFHKFRSNNS